MIVSLTQITQTRLLHLRWLSVLGMVAAAVASPNILGSPDAMPRLLAFATVIGCANVCLTVAAALYRNTADGLPMFSPLVQLSFDLMAWASYIYLSGGASNPLISVFLPIVAVGAIALRPVQAWVLAAGAIAAYSFLWNFHVPLSIVDAKTATRLHLLGMWAVFVVSAVVVVWFILQMTDAIRKRDAALAEAREQAIRDDWLISLGSLAAGAAHELSTPLGILNILSDELLEYGRLPPEASEDVCQMKRQIGVCKQALQQLTQQAGQPRGLALEKVNAVDWLQRILAAWESLNPRAEIRFEHSPDLLPCRLAAHGVLDRALGNLLDNAVKAGARHLRVAAGRDDDCLNLTIQDDGPGMPPEALNRFHRQQPADSVHGLGIGLLLTRATVERHGGALTLTPIENGGTLAQLSLPLAC